MELRNSTSGLRVIVLSIIVLITGISFIPTLQIGVQGQLQQQDSATPVISPTPTTPPTSTATTDSTTPSRPNPNDDPQQILTGTTVNTVQFTRSPLTVQFPQFPQSPLTVQFTQSPQSPQSPLTVQFPPGVVLPLNHPPQ